MASVADPAADPRQAKIATAAASAMVTPSATWKGT